jgi:hypothetical protein
MEPIAEPAIKLIFKGVIDSARKRIKANKNMDGPAGTEAPSPPPRLISLFTLSDKRDDLIGKRAGPFGAPVNEPAQPAHKKPPQYDPGTDPSFQARVAEMYTNQEKEKEGEDEVKRSCQNIQWTHGPLPAHVDHWFYDLKNAGTEPPESLVAASRKMMLAWKKALGRGYFPFDKHDLWRSSPEPRTCASYL